MVVDGHPPFQFWTERLAAWLGFDRAADRLFGDREYAAYLFVGAVLFLDVPVLSTVGYLLPRIPSFHPLLEYPWWWLIPVALLLGIRGMRRMRATAVEAALTVREEGVAVSTPAIRSIRFLLFAIGLLLYVVGPLRILPTILSVEGVFIGGFKWLVIIPAVYIPVAVDFVTTYLLATVLIPVYVLLERPELNFEDPLRFGGLAPTGTSLTVAAEYHFLALGIYTLVTFLDNILLANPVFGTKLTRLEVGFFLATWILGVCLLVLGIHLVHRHMAAEKLEKLEELSVGLDDRTARSFTNVAPDETEEALATISRYLAIHHVERTRTYPLAVSRLWEVFAAAGIPLVLQVASIVFTTYL